MAFVLDHVWIATAKRDGALAALSAVTGLEVLDAWAPDRQVRSRGVRFANGPFLDVHSEESGSGAVVLLRGSLADAEALAAARGWAVKASRRDDVPADRRPPWSLLFFRRGQGALSSLGIIEYEANPRGYGLPEYAQPLLFLDSVPTVGPRLARVTVGGGGAIEALGCRELATSQGEGVVRIDIEGVEAAPLSIGGVQVIFSP